MGKIYLLFFLFFKFTGVIACQSNTIDTVRYANGLLQEHSKSMWLKKVLDEGRLLSPEKKYSINILTDIATGEEFLKFELRDGESWKDITGARSYRTEIDTRDKPAMRSVKWYRFSVLFSKDFPIEYNRFVFAQWHGADKWWLGEPSRDPVLSFRFINSQFSIKLVHSAERIVKNPDSVWSDKIFKTKTFDLGKWNDFVIEAKWSYEDDGFLNIWWNNKQIVKYNGPVGYNDDTGPHFQFGIYRDKSDKTYISNMKNVRSGNKAIDIGFKADKENTTVEK
jgi:hypothetical protein